MGLGTLCEILKCPPSYIERNYPDLTYQDYAFLTQYGMAKMDMLGRMLGLRESRGMMRKQPPINR